MDANTTEVEMDATETGSTDSGVAESGTSMDTANSECGSVASDLTITTDSGRGDSVASTGTVTADSSAFGSTESLETITSDTATVSLKSDASGSVDIVTVDGSRYNCSMDSSTTVDQIKHEVYEQSQIPVEQQRLFHGKYVITDGTLGNNGVRAGETVFLTVEPPFDINVQLPDGKVTSFSVQSNTSVTELKQKISERFGYAEDHQSLDFGVKELNDGRLRHHSIEQGTTLRLRLRQRDIFVSDFQGKSHTIQVQPNCTVGTLKKKVAQKIGVPERQQRLEYRGRGLQNDTATLEYYNVGSQATVQLQGRLRGG